MHRLLLLVLLIILCQGNTHAFPSKECSKTFAKRRRPLNYPRQLNGGDDTNSLNTATTRTSLRAATLKFKNMEAMIESFGQETVLLAFQAVNCGPCRLQKQELVNFRELLSDGQIKMLAIDTEKWPRVGSRYAVSKLPCLVLLKDKQVVARLEGLTPAEVLLEHVRMHLH